MKSVLLIGLGRFGRHLAMQLNELGHQVMAVDKDEERVNECMPFVTNAQIGDSTRVDFLRSLGVSNYDVCYVTISGDFQNSLETTSLLKELGANYVVSRAERDVQAKFLLRNGADAVAYPEKQLAKWAAIRYTGPQHRRVGHPQKIWCQHPRRKAERQNRCEHLTGNHIGRKFDSAGAGRKQSAEKTISPLNPLIHAEKNDQKKGTHAQWRVSHFYVMARWAAQS